MTQGAAEQTESSRLGFDQVGSLAGTVTLLCAPPISPAGLRSQSAAALLNMCWVHSGMSAP